MASELNGQRDLVRPAEIPVQPGPYFGVAWVTPEVLATVVPVGNREDAVVLVGIDGAQFGFVPLDARPSECVLRIVTALTAMPTGELGMADICEHERKDSPQTTTLLAYDVVGDGLRTLGATAEQPVAMTWAPDMARLVYAASGSLCATLYTRNATDGPLTTVIRVQGTDIPLGEDLAQSEDRCTEFGNANYPAYSPEGDVLAAFAAATGTRRGQDRIDQEWALVIVREDGTSDSIVDGIRYPRGLGWLSSERLSFAGQLYGLDGLWIVELDGRPPTRIGDIRLASIAVSADGTAISGIVMDSILRADPLELANRMIWYDVRDYR